jgi:methionyl-tRNA formyltransferase
MRIGFAGDRDISLAVLDFLLSQGVAPVTLLVSAPDRASHAEVLRSRCAYLPDSRVFVGSEFRSGPSLRVLDSLDIDFIIGVHFPYLFPSSVLDIPRVGVLNLHPSFLPFNRGWHTPSWAILEGTPIGATLHFMSETLDAGDIVHQRQLAVTPADTAHSLYGRVKTLEYEVFVEAWPALADGSYQRLEQHPSGGTVHQRADLLIEAIQRLDLHAQEKIGDVLLRLRALTTNRLDEACYFDRNGSRYRVQVQITEEDGESG